MYLIEGEITYDSEALFILRKPGQTVLAASMPISTANDGISRSKISTTTGEIPLLANRETLSGTLVGICRRTMADWDIEKRPPA
jgi:hypothetical protein